MKDNTSKTLLNSTQEGILSDYLDNTLEYIKKTIERQLEERDEELILEDFRILYVVANGCVADYEKLLREVGYEEKTIAEHEGVACLRDICRRCSREVANDDDDAFKQSKILGSLTDEELKNEIGKYFRDGINAYVKQKSSEVKDSCGLSVDPYEEAEKEFLNPKPQNIEIEETVSNVNANDNLPSSLLTPQSSEQLQRQRGGCCIMS